MADHSPTPRIFELETERVTELLVGRDRADRELLTRVSLQASPGLACTLKTNSKPVLRVVLPALRVEVFPFLHGGLEVWDSSHILED
jgi:hypothetical protein